MIYEIYTENGTKKKRALTGDGYGLPLGTWISYEGTCPDGFIESEQTFNTTTYASLYALLGTNKVPARFDHSKLSDYEDITISSDSNNPTVMQYDGILVINARGAPKEVYCNGKILAGVTTGSPIDNTASFLFNKGDELYVINPQANTIYVAYYKRHLAIKATPAYVEPDTVSDMVYTMRVQDSYSTEEVNTGKKWIDGKPIYRKVTQVFISGVLQSGISRSGSTYTNSNKWTHNAETVILSQCQNKRGSGEQENIYGGTVSGMFCIWQNDSQIALSIPGSNVSVSVIFEYTKTTD